MAIAWLRHVSSLPICILFLSNSILLLLIFLPCLCDFFCFLLCNFSQVVFIFFLPLPKVASSTIPLQIKIQISIPLQISTKKFKNSISKPKAFTLRPAHL